MTLYLELVLQKASKRTISQQITDIPGQWITIRQVTVKVWFASQNFIMVKDSGGGGGCTKFDELEMQKKFLATGEACKGMLWTTPVSKERSFSEQYNILDSLHRPFSIKRKESHIGDTKKEGSDEDDKQYHAEFQVFASKWRHNKHLSPFQDPVESIYILLKNENCYGAQLRRPQ